ncbi:MAG: isochorismatase [Cyanobacteria bacterium P01_F01_bin.150]
MTDTSNTSEVEKVVSEASQKWKAAFNSGNAAGCAAQYENGAVMYARPLGTFNGINDIKSFWQNLIADGYADVEYIGPEIEVLNETTAVLTSKWRMNKASGVIHKELWVIQDDGTAKLREDDFEVTG